MARSKYSITADLTLPLREEELGGVELKIRKQQLPRLEEMMEMLNCVACGETVTYPASQCQSGHLICGEDCSVQFGVCPGPCLIEPMKRRCGASLIPANALWFKIALRKMNFKCPVETCDQMVLGQNDEYSHLILTHPEIAPTAPGLIRANSLESLERLPPVLSPVSSAARVPTGFYRYPSFVYDTLGGVMAILNPPSAEEVEAAGSVFIN